MKRLLDLGFYKAGKWESSFGVLEYHLDTNENQRNVLYSFVLDEDVKYIGKTVKTLVQRLNGYKNPNKSQRTNFRIHHEIREVLRKHKSLDILVFVDNVQLKYRDFKINLSAGLEDTLIAELDPAWNSNGKNKPQITFNTKTRNIPINESNNSFSVIIGTAYYNDGFFNVSVKYSELFGVNGSDISIQLGKSSKINGRINRTANTNGTPRIMAGKVYTSWIKRNFKLGDLLNVDVISSDFIILSK